MMISQILIINPIVLKQFKKGLLQNIFHKLILSDANHFLHFLTSKYYKTIKQNVTLQTIKYHQKKQNKINPKKKFYKIKV